MPRVVRWKRLGVVVGVLAAGSAGAYAANAAQIKRQASALSDRAIAAADAGRADEAIGLLDQYLKHRPGDEAATRRLAGLALDRATAEPKRRAWAADRAEAFLRRFPHHPDERRRLVTLYLDMDRVGSARQHARLLLDGSTDPDLLDQAAVCELAPGGDPRAAAGLLDRAVRTGTAPARAVDRLLGLLHADKPTAREFPPEAYLDLLARDPYQSRPDVRVAVARFHLLRGDKPHAREEATAALALPGGEADPNARLTMAEVELAEIAGPETVGPQLRKAADWLAPAADADPKNARIALLLARVRADLGDPAGAVAVLKATAAVLTPADAGFVPVADRLIDLGDRATAVGLAARAAADPGAVGGKYLRGRLAAQAGDWATARPLLDEVAPALAAVPEFHKKALADLGRCHEALRDADAQLASYAAARRDDPNYLPAVAGEADALLKLGRPRDALARLRTLVHGYGRVELRPVLARLELRAVLAEPPAVRSWDGFDRAVGPAAGRTAELRAIAADGLAARGDGGTAAAELAAAITADPKNATGWLARAAGLPPTDRAAIDRVAPLDTADWRLLLFRGGLLTRAGDEAAAGLAFGRAVERGGDDAPEAWVALVAHHTRAGRADEARRVTAEAARQFRAGRRTAERLVAVGNCHELTGDRPAAEAAYRDATRTDPADPDAARQLVRFLQRTGREADAAALLRQLSDGPELAPARWARRHRAVTLMTDPDAYHLTADAHRLIDRNTATGATPDPEDAKARAVVRTADPATRNEGIAALKEFAAWGDLTPDEFALLARLLLDQGKAAEAADYFERAARPRAGVTAGHVAELVGVYLALRKLAPARAAVQRLRAMAPQSWEAAREDARVLRREADEVAAGGDLARSKELTEQARALVGGFPDRSAGFVAAHTGPLLEELGFVADAEAAFRTLEANGEHRPLAGFLLRQKRPAEVVPLAFKHQPAAGPVTTARMLTAAARGGLPDGGAEVSGWFDRTLAAVAGSPDLPLLLGSRAEFLEAVGRYDEALSAYEEAVRRLAADPARAVDADLVTNNLSMLLSVHRPERAGEAVGRMTGVIARRGPAAAFLDTRAVAHLAGGKADEAVADLNLALVQRRRPAYLVHLARAYEASPDRKPLAADLREEARRLGLTAADLHPLERR